MQDIDTHSDTDPASDRRSPSGMEMLKAIWDLKTKMAVLQAKQEESDRRMDSHDALLSAINTNLSTYAADLASHMTQEAKDRAEIFRRINWTLLGVIVSGAALILDLVTNYLKG